MHKCVHKNIHKISTRFAPASLAAAGEELVRLRRLLQSGTEVSDDLSHIVTKVKSIPAPSGEPFIFTTCLDDNEKQLREVFRNCDDVLFRPFWAGETQALLVYLYELTDMALLNNDVLQTLMVRDGQSPSALTLENLLNKLITIASLRTTDKVSEAVEATMTGAAILVVDGLAEIIILKATKYVKRPVEEAKSETVARGPHDAFTETLEDNLALIRRRSKDPNIKVRVVQLGARSKTDLAIVYAANIVKPGLVAEVERRLNRIKIDHITLSAQVEEFIIDHPWSPFPQTHVTERPETLVVSIYEGRVALILDNTPYALIVPCTLSSMIQSTEDFAIQPVIASLIRFSRYVSAFLGVFLPSIYIAIVSYNPGMMPTSLAITVAELRARTPYPAVMEVIIMEIILELFQEAVLRMPQKIAPAASIVGGFVIGTTIVQAGIVNALLVVAIAGTAIASYTMPSYNLSLALRWLRIPMILLTAILGFYGMVLGYLVLVVFMCSLRSFGESFAGGLFDITLFEDMQDKLVRLPMTWMSSRPKIFGSQNRTRMGDQNGRS